jgi:uncharacterized protein
VTESTKPGEQAWADVGRAAYVSFTSYRKDGTPVSTPVWIAPDGDDLYFFSDTGAHKVKRIRNNPAVTLRPCDVRGRVKEGAPLVTGLAEVLDHSETPRVRRIVNRKYRIQGTIGTLFSRLRGVQASIGIRIQKA